LDWSWTELDSIGLSALIVVAGWYS
jgi:hypothetical protein